MNDTLNQCQNTDKELWRETPGDYYANSIHVTENGLIGMNCGGHVVAMPIRKWFEVAGGNEMFKALQEQQTKKLPDTLIQEILSHKRGGGGQPLSTKQTLIGLLQKVKAKLDRGLEEFKGNVSHPAFDFVEDAHEDIVIYLSDPDNQREITDAEEGAWQAINSALTKRNYTGSRRTEFVDYLWEAIKPYLKREYRPHPDTSLAVRIRNALHFLNLDRADIKELPDGATITSNITNQRNIGALLQDLLAYIEVQTAKENDE